ncbi:MAG: Hpt domain-containing protein [Gammaproteobacteria bacterium]|nr:Hpt domain-containing protein [Gammaproteobacteria bacterium]
MSQSVDTDNLEMLKEVIGDDLIEILQAYLDTTPAIMMKIQSSLNMGDAASVQLNAHTLKGSSANIGATLLPDLSAQLESLAKAGDLSTQAESIYSSIIQEDRNVSLFLKTYIQQF